MYITCYCGTSPRSYEEISWLRGVQEEWGVGGRGRVVGRGTILVMPLWGTKFNTLDQVMKTAAISATVH